MVSFSSCNPCRKDVKRLHLILLEYGLSPTGKAPGDGVLHSRKHTQYTQYSFVQSMEYHSTVSPKTIEECMC